MNVQVNVNVKLSLEEFHSLCSSLQLSTRKIFKLDGLLVVPTSVYSFAYDKSSNEVIETNSAVYAKNRECIFLTEIRKKSTLEKHERLGIIRADSIGMKVTRHLTIHRYLAGHGHLIVLVSVEYDTAIYLRNR